MCNFAVVMFYRVQYSFEKVNSCFIAMNMTIVIAYLVNKPLPAAGTLEVNGRGCKIVRKMNSWPRSKASRATVKF